ncbi:MAG: winged helix-turn-helix domain-containing protein [Pseudomonadota bacterium]
MFWTIGEYRFDANANRLSGHNGEVLLEPKASALLTYFCEHPGRNINRDELLEAVWHGQVVSDNTINRVIVLLRKALGDEDKARRYIATVPKVGYRLIADVAVAERPAASSEIIRPRAATNESNRGLLMALGLVLLSTVGLVYWGTIAPSTVQVRSITPLSRLPTTQSNAAVAKDGQALLYTASDGEYDRIFYVSETGSEPQPVSASGGDADFATWSHDGSFIVYQFFDGERCEFHRVTRAQFADKPYEVVYECVPGSYSELSLAPDDSTLYFLERSAPTGPYAAFAMSLEQGSKRRLSQPVASGYGNHYLDVHPQRGTLLLLSDHRPGKTSAFELDPASDSFTLLRTFAYSLDSAIWSHRDGFIVHPSRHPSYQLLESPIGRGESRVVVSDSRRISSPRRLPPADAGDHDYLFTSYLFNRDIDTTQNLNVDINSAVMDYLPAISRSGQQLAFVSKRSGYSQIWIKDFASGRLFALDPPDRGRRFLDLDWSADDGQLLANTNAGVLVYSLADSPRLIHNVAFSLPAYAVGWVDSQTLSLSHFENGRWRAYQHKLTTGEKVSLGERWAFSLNGPDQQILIDQSLVAFREGAPLSPLKNCASPVWRYQLRWRIDGEDIYCHANDGFADLLRFDRKMRSTRLPNAVDRFEFFSARSGQLATTRVASSHSDIMRTRNASG